MAVRSTSQLVSIADGREFESRVCCVMCEVMRGSRIDDCQEPCERIWERATPMRISWCRILCSFLPELWCACVEETFFSVLCSLRSCSVWMDAAERQVKLRQMRGDEIVKEAGLSVER
jgi:hypothetical protein